MTRRLLLVALVLAPAVSGCKPTKMPQLYPVKGRVVRGGQPLAKALVRLIPEMAGEDLKISGITDADGNYQIETLEPQANKRKAGAPEGSYKVQVLLPIDDKQSGGGTFQLGQGFRVQAGENTIPSFDVTLPTK